MTSPATTFDWEDEQKNSAPSGNKTFEWGDEGEEKKPPQSTQEQPSFLQRAATQPTQFSRYNPLRYLDQLGQGMAAGTEAIIHPVDTAAKIYHGFTEEGQKEIEAANKADSQKPLLQGLGDVADETVQGWGQAIPAAGIVKGVKAVIPEPVSTIRASAPRRLTGPIEGEYVPAQQAEQPQGRWANARVVQPKLLPSEASPAQSLPYRKTTGIVQDDLSAPQRFTAGKIPPRSGLQLKGEVAPPAYPGANLPERPTPELMRSRTLATGPQRPGPSQSAALGRIPARQVPTQAVPAEPKTFAGMDFSSDAKALDLAKQELASGKITRPQLMSRAAEIKNTLKAQQGVAPNATAKTPKGSPFAATDAKAWERYPAVNSKQDLAETRDLQAQAQETAVKEQRGRLARGNEEGFARNTRARTAKGELSQQFQARQPAVELSPNASGESAASQEAINRAASEKSAGVKRVVVDTRSGIARPLIGADAVDYQPRAYESVEFRGGKRDGEIIAQGRNARAYRRSDTGRMNRRD